VRTIKAGLPLWAVWTLASFAFWTAVALVFALSRLAGSADWRSPLLASLAAWWSWGLLTPAVVGLNRRLADPRRHVATRLATTLLLGVGVTIAYVYVDAVLDAVLRSAPLPDLTDQRLFAGAFKGMFWEMLVYGLIVSAWTAARNQRRALAAELSMAHLERSYAEARLNVLRLQLDPHFLFNALNTISSQLQTEPRLARRMIEHLGDLLRLSLEPKSRHEVPLAEELAFLDHYLAIQKIRFGEDLKIELAIARDVEAALVPSLFMQPLVENAIRHGISRRAGGGTIRVTARRDANLLDIRVSDDGVGLPTGWSLDADAGLGLSVTRERVAGFHPGDGHRFIARRRPQGGTEIEIAFPFRLKESAVDRVDA